MTFLQFSQWLLWAAIVLTWLKSITGYHFPWEICSCCGKKYKNHVNTQDLPEPASFSPKWNDYDDFPF